MTPDEREQMHILCQRLAVEQDREKFSGYIGQMNALLGRKLLRLEVRDSVTSGIAS